MHIYSIGDGVSITQGSDRHAGTVIAVSASGKTVTVQQDDGELLNQDGKGIFGNQQYTFKPNDKGIVRTFRRHKDGRFYGPGGWPLMSPGRSAFYDPHF